MADAKEAVLGYVAPALGTVLANVMFSSPMRAVIRARASGDTGPLNPVPYPVIMANTLAWQVLLPNSRPDTPALGLSRVNLNMFLFRCVVGEILLNSRSTQYPRNRLIGSSGPPTSLVLSWALSTALAASLARRLPCAFAPSSPTWSSFSSSLLVLVSSPCPTPMTSDEPCRSALGSLPMPPCLRITLRRSAPSSRLHAPRVPRRFTRRL